MHGFSLQVPLKMGSTSTVHARTNPSSVGFFFYLLQRSSSSYFHERGPPETHPFHSHVHHTLNQLSASFSSVPHPSALHAARASSSSSSQPRLPRLRLPSPTPAACCCRAAGCCIRWPWYMSRRGRDCMCSAVGGELSLCLVAP